MSFSAKFAGTCRGCGERIAKVALFVAMGGILPQHTDDGVTATAKAVYEANASMGHYWSKDRGFYGKGFTEPA